jgi:hypothetical protein
MQRRLAPTSLGLALLAACTACNGAAPVSDPASPAASTAAAASSAKASTSTGASAAASVGASASPSASPSAGASSDPCGGLPCKELDDPAAAMDVLLAEKPLFLAIGETHAQKGTEGVASTTARFTESLLPKLEKKASSLVLELWVADGKCGKEKEAHVEKQQKEVTKNQAESNQNEFVTLGEKAKALGVVPFILRPTCDEYDKIQKAGDDAVFEMLSMITRNMKSRAEKLFDESQKKSPDLMVVTYGGAMHNDVAPREGREQWSYAKDLSERAKGRYVELDLIVPEYVKDTDAWKSQPWYPAFKARNKCDKPVLFTTTPKADGKPSAYALVFACTKKP